MCESATLAGGGFAKCNMYLSIIIPAYNEAERIGKTLNTIVEFLSPKGYDWEIVVVDDGSKDDTVKVVNDFGHSKIRVLSQPRNMGKGAAVRRGMIESKGQYRIFSDADLSTPIKEADKLLSVMESGADICIGSRALDRNQIKEHQPFYREWMGRIFNLFVQTIVFRGISDTQCGFKAFSASAADSVFSASKIDGFSFDVEALFLAKRMGFRVEQVSVEWYNDDRSKVNPIRDSINMFVELFRIRKLHKKG